jgi:AraC family transcriptional regulator of adaptative response / DNA-3-methyladenine glycosylase II
VTEIAFASGFASVRRFNSLFRARFGRPPGAVRRQVARPDAAGLVLRLDYRPPLAWRALLEFLALRATPGVEVVELDAGRYARTVAIGAAEGSVEVTAHATRPALIARIDAALVPVAMPLVARLRALFDLDAEPAVIDRALGADPRLRRSVRATPGLRVPQAFEPFEACARIVLGQQVSVRGATTLTGRLVAAHGAPVATTIAGLTHRFPTAAELARVPAATIATIGLPGARARTLVGLAGALATARVDRAMTPDALMQLLGGVPGIGPWTRELCAMRVLGWPDAFPGSDLVVRRALDAPDAARAEAQVEHLRPWRAYATMHLWRLA